MVSISSDDHVEDKQRAFWIPKMYCGVIHDLPSIPHRTVCGEDILSALARIGVGTAVSEEDMKRERRQKGPGFL